jgi:hypothetical protein
MELPTHNRHLRTDIEIGIWGTTCALVLFLTSAFVEYFTRGEVTGISNVGCLVGVATVGVILVRARLFAVASQRRKALRKRIAGLF